MWRSAIATTTPYLDPMEDLTTTLFNLALTLAVIAGTVTAMALVMKFFDDTLSDR